MSSITRVELIDDVDGVSPAAETVTFGLDGAHFEIDLSEGNAARLRTELAPWIAAARHIRRRGGQKPQSARGSATNPSRVRAWAKRNGVPVGKRGRIPAEVILRYRADKHRAVDRPGEAD